MGDRLTTAQVEEIRERAEYATKGPWFAAYSAVHSACCEATGEWREAEDGTNGCPLSEEAHGNKDCTHQIMWVPTVSGDLPTKQGVADALFAAHARSDIPALLADREEMGREIKAAWIVAEAWKARAEKAEAQVAAYVEADRLWADGFDEAHPEVALSPEEEEAVKSARGIVDTLLLQSRLKQAEAENAILRAALEKLPGLVVRAICEAPSDDAADEESVACIHVDRLHSIIETQVEHMCDSALKGEGK